MPVLDEMAWGNSRSARPRAYGINALAFALCALGVVACSDDAPMTPAGPSVAGSVTADGVGLAGVTVDLQSQLVVTTTDANGRFEFFDVAAGAHTLTVSGLPATVYCGQKTFGIDVTDPTTTLGQDFGCTENPSMAQLEGTWDFTLTNTVNTCGGAIAPFTLPATVSINATTPTDLDVLFPTPALPITGPFDATTGMFTGTTSGFDFGGGQTSTEAWTTDFIFNTDNPEATGVSNVVLTDAAQTVLCGADFALTGMRTGS